MTDKAFQNIIYSYYKKHRRDLPWRNTDDPYHILVSEVMLQQTQVERVTEKYIEFIKKFPTVRVLADASLQEVLKVWSGLGYNRRGLFLHQAANTITTQFKGVVSSDTEVLKTLPGIGQYTASAIASFAYNQPTVCIETNIRSVYLHFFFTGSDKVHDTDILPIIKRTLDTKQPREWYWALMDYGAMLKRTQPNPSRKSIYYKKQTPFKKSNREVRGAIIKLLTEARVSKDILTHSLNFNKKRIEENLTALIREGLVAKSGRIYCIA